MGRDTASRTDAEPPNDAVAIRGADIAALEARVRRSVIGLAIAVTALFLILGGTVVGFMTAVEERRAFQEAIRPLTDRTARSEERLGAHVPTPALTLRAE